MPPCPEHGGDRGSAWLPPLCRGLLPARPCPREGPPPPGAVLEPVLLALMVGAASGPHPAGLVAHVAAGSLALLTPVLRSVHGLRVGAVLSSEEVTFWNFPVREAFWGTLRSRLSHACCLVQSMAYLTCDVQTASRFLF